MRPISETTPGTEPPASPFRRTSPMCRRKGRLEGVKRGEDRKEKLLEDGTLMKTPVVRNGRQATVGYCPEVWEKWE